MKKYLFLIALGICSLHTFAQQSAPAPEGNGFRTVIGQRSPNFSFEIEKGKTTSIKDYKGKYVLINFFATWCPPCNQELPIAQKEVWEKHKDNPKFAFLVFGREEDWEKLIPFKEKKGFTFPILPDKDRSIFDLFAPNGIPRNVVIDPEGKIIYQSIGFSPEEFEKLVAFIDSKL